MMMTPSHLLVAACSSVLMLVTGAACVELQEPSPWHEWGVLRLKAKAAPLFRGQVEMRLTDTPEGRRLETATTARFFGATIARSNTTTQLEAGTGRPKRYESFSRKRGRRYVFNEDGYSVERLGLEKENGNDAHWEVTWRKEFAYPRSPDGDETVRLFDYYGMLLHLRELKLDEPEDEVTVTVATSKGPQSYRIRVSESRAADRAFTDLATGEKTQLAIRELRLTISPTDPEAAEGFLNMVGDTEIWVEAESKTLLEIHGKIPKVPGRVRVVLTAMGGSPSG